MLQGDFYTILNKQVGDSEFIYNIKLNSNHSIYRGHFPETPVTPGVCQVAIVKECLEDGLKKKLFLKNAKNIKFAGLNNPEENDKLLVRISFSRQESDLYKVNASIVDENENIILKLRGEYSGRL